MKDEIIHGRTTLTVIDGNRIASADDFVNAGTRGERAHALGRLRQHLVVDFELRDGALEIRSIWDVNGPLVDLSASRTLEQQLRRNCMFAIAQRERAEAALAAELAAAEKDKP